MDLRIDGHTHPGLTVDQVRAVMPTIWAMVRDPEISGESRFRVLHLDSTNLGADSVGESVSYTYFLTPASSISLVGTISEREALFGE